MLEDLIERVKKASGPDRELDRAIADWHVGHPRHAFGGDANYTGSYDAARTVAPSGCTVDTQQRYKNSTGILAGPPVAWARIESADGKTFLAEAIAATVPLAVLAAALKSRSAQAGGV